MSIIDKNIYAKIESIQKLSWSASGVDVSPRPYCALLFRKSGSASFTSKTASVISNSGDITYMPANYAYHADYFNENNVCFIHFTSDLGGEAENFSLSVSKTAEQLFYKAFDIWTARKKGYYFQTAEIFYRILNLICTSNENSYSKNRYPDFYNAVNYLNNNFSKSTLSIAELANMSNMSETYFRKIFIKNFSSPPASYLAKLRLEHAEKLLAEGKYSIEEVAQRCGFNDVKYFSRVIKSAYGYPPSKLFIHS